GVLNPNTTYFVRVGALYNGATTYSTVLATATLTTLITDAQFYQVNVTSVVVNWTPLGSADGYRLEAATDAGFTNVIQSSVTTDVNFSTLTIQSLNAYTTYYFRVGGINNNQVVNYTVMGATQTRAGSAPVASITNVYVSSMTLAWADVNDNNGYVLEAS